MTRARERERETSPLPSLISGRACVNRCTRVEYIDFKRHAASISRRQISYSHKRNGSTFSGKFLSMEMYRTSFFLFFFCEKYKYIRRKETVLVVYESFTRIIGSKNFFKNIYISFELKPLYIRYITYIYTSLLRATIVALHKMSRVVHTTND